MNWNEVNTVGGLRKNCFVSQAKTPMYTHLAAVAYNLLRISRLAVA
jgi:hypothetical protein